MDEKQGENAFFLKKNLSNCHLNDLGYHGPKYTWSNKRFTNKNTLIKERLYHFLGNDPQLNIFSDSKVYHMYSGGSDHIPYHSTH